jgi:5,10-methylene-tetrahydrofolate dehydrogenase/methenyl tetrahydrofolate cyclohydrolase
MIQVGAREDSSIYVKMKDKAAKEVISFRTCFFAGMNF